MSVSKLAVSGGANDFNVSIGGPYTSVTFNKEYSAGAYTVESALSDTTYDIYALNAAGVVVGYSNTPSLSVSSGFIKLVILGQTTNNLLSFSYKTTYTTTSDSDEIATGPVVESVSPSAIPNVDGTTTITGRNFAENATVTFSSTNGVYTSTAAKSVTRVNATTLTVTRPDNFPIGNSPFTITVQNPSAITPTGSNSHILANSVTAGVSPVWVTSTTLPEYTRYAAYSTTVSATDADAGSTISYSVVTDTLPTGLSFNTSTATISGTPTVLTSGGITIRATDAGGNFVDRAFTIAVLGVNAPTWVTAAGALTSGATGTAYSVQLSATDDSGSNPTYALQSGTLPPGLSISSSGLISGTPTDGNGNASFTIRASDANGSFTDRAFSIGILMSRVITATTSITFATSTVFSELFLVGGGAAGGGTAGYNGGGSGGGGGGEAVYATNVTVSAGTHSFVIGAGGAATTGSDTRVGGETSVASIGYYARGGNGGARSGNSGTSAQYYNPAITGGGNASYASGRAAPNNQGSPTYPATEVSNNSYGGGGGGAGGYAPDAAGGIGVTRTIGGVTYNVGGGGNGGNSASDGSYNFLGGYPYGGGQHNYINGQPGYNGATNRGGGGGGRNAIAETDAIGSNGGSGIIVGRYLG